MDRLAKLPATRIVRASSLYESEPLGDAKTWFVNSVVELETDFPPDDPAAQAEIFAATQLMVRPGLAQTQAVLARELTGGTDEASRLFRQSVTLTRQVERNRIELALGVSAGSVSRHGDRECGPQSGGRQGRADRIFDAEEAHVRSAAV